MITQTHLSFCLFVFIDSLYFIRFLVRGYPLILAKSKFFSRLFSLFVSGGERGYVSTDYFGSSLSHRTLNVCLFLLFPLNMQLPESAFSVFFALSLPQKLFATSNRVFTLKFAPCCSCAYLALYMFKLTMDLILLFVIYQ